MTKRHADHYEGRPSQQSESEDHQTLGGSKRYARSDANLAARAIRLGWIDEAQLEAVAGKLLNRTEEHFDDGTLPRDTAALGRVVVALADHRQRDEHLAVKVAAVTQSSDAGVVEVYAEDELAADSIIARRSAEPSLPPSTLPLPSSNGHITNNPENGHTS